MKDFARPSASIAAIAMALGLGASPAWAGGYYIQEQSAKETGRAYSGDAAAADSPATVFFNPAAMTQLEGLQLEGNGHAIFVTTTNEDRGSTRTVPGTMGTPLIGGKNGGNPFPQPLAVPSTYATYQASDRLWLGVAVFSPFGLKTEYDEGFFGRYDALRSELFTVNVQPSVAYKVSDTLSVGGGIDVQYAKVHLTSALPGLAPTSPDGLLDVEGDDISVSFNLGVFGTSGPWKIGAHYRSEMSHRLEGDIEVSGLTGLLAAGNEVLPVSAPLTLPDIGTFSLAYDNGGRARAYATARWYDWSDFNEIRLQSDGRPDRVTTENYEDSVSIAFGGEYDLSDRLTLRSGTMYDVTPTQDQFRNTRVPDSDRLWLSAGATYDLTDHMELTFGYAHIFMDAQPVVKTRTFYEGSPAAITTQTRSRVSSDIDMFALSVSSRF